MIEKTPTAGIILAAGESLRFVRLKQLATWNGKPLLRWVIEAAEGSHLDRIILVLGHREPLIRRRLGACIDPSRIEITVNPDYAMGQSTSVKAGLKCVSDQAGSVMFLMADQPLITSRFIDELLERYLASRKEICVPEYEGKRGTPTIFSRRFFPQISRIAGDKGARDIIRRNPAHVLSVETAPPVCLKDVDTPEDLRTLDRLNALHSLNPEPATRNPQSSTG